MALTRYDILVTSSVAIISWVITATWVPSLRFIPYAFATGFSAALLFVVTVFLATSKKLPGREFVQYPRSSYLSVTSSSAKWRTETASLKKRLAYQRPVTGKDDEISKHISLIVDLILRDFVKSWYKNIGPSTAFPNSVDLALVDAVGKIRERIKEKDLIELGVTRLLPILTSHIKDFNEAERQVRGKKLNRNVTESEELDLAIAARYRNGKLHPAASLTIAKPTSTQGQHLRRLVGRLLPEVLTASMTTSSSVLVMIREIVSCAVLLPVMQLLADPDMLNQLIEAYGRSVLQERKTVQKLRAALDKHTSPKPSKVVSSIAMPQLQPGDDERLFERFIRAIRLCNSLSDAKRFRSDIQSQIRRESIAPRSRDVTYLRRLETGGKLLDQKIAQLASSLRGRPNPNGSRYSHSSFTNDSQRNDATLRDILYSASGLSYFMEFMDRVNLLKLVQFWIVVDGFRGPLDVHDSTSQIIDEPTRQDFEQVAATYVDAVELNLPEQSTRIVHEFLRAGKRATATQYKNARTILIDAQNDVYTEMTDNHFPKFKRSDLYYKWLSSDTSTQVPNVLASNETDLSQSTESLLSRGKLSGVKVGNEPVMRPSAGSSSDLVFVAKQSQSRVQTTDDRLSLDDTRPSLFGDDERESEDFMTQSTRSLNFHAGHPLRSLVDEDQDRMEAAVQAALEDIVDEKPDEGPLFTGLPGTESPLRTIDSPRNSIDMPRPDVEHNVISVFERQRPTLDSLGLLGTSAKRTVFNSDDLFGEGEKLWEEGSDHEDRTPASFSGKRANTEHVEEEEEIHEAAPGDLGLAELIQGLNQDIDKLEAQQSVVDSLTQKAELTNNVAELRILRKSKESLKKEIRRKELQRQQYILQESDNSLYGRASITIQSIMVGTQSDGHEFALYVIEIQREASSEKGTPTSWAVARRYSEFHELHKRLRSEFGFVKNLDFPRRQMVLTLQKDFLRKRRAALEKYLQLLLANPVVCRSLAFRAFLSKHTIRQPPGSSEINRQDFVTRIYNSVTDGMEDFLGNLPVLDQLSAAGQNLISAASGYAQLSNSTIAGPSEADAAETEEGEAEITAFETARNPEVVSFIRPICDAFLEIFQLNQSNNWLRGRALVAIIQQLLGGTIERRVRDSFKSLTTEEQIVQYLSWLRGTLWPQGKFRMAPVERTEAEKALSRREATLVLAALLPDIAGNVVGKSNATKAGRRIFAALNNAQLNQHLMYTLLDEVVDAFFGVRIAR